MLFFWILIFHLSILSFIKLSLLKETLNFQLLILATCVSGKMENLGKRMKKNKLRVGNVTNDTVFTLGQNKITSFS